MNALEELKQGMEDLWESVGEGWRHLRERTAGALTRFKRRLGSVPAAADDELSLPGWALLAGDVFEDERKVVVRLEVPGMEKGDFDIEVRDDVLIVSGEKRFERESSEGRYRVLQCAYGSFQRTIPLPGPVIAQDAKATYRNGVLKIELSKAETARPRTIEVKVH